LNTEDLKSFEKAMTDLFFEVLGMEDEKISDSSNDKLEGTVNMLIEMRKQARDNKNFALSDQIRDQLIALEFSSKTVKKELL
jgi:cysteinyl-tRNA synthetase